MFKATIAALSAALAIAAFALPSHSVRTPAVSSVKNVPVKSAVKHAPAVKSQDCQGCPLDNCPLGSKADCGTCPATGCDR